MVADVRRYKMESGKLPKGEYYILKPLWCIFPSLTKVILEGNYKSRFVVCKPYNRPKTYFKGTPVSS